MENKYIKTVEYRGYSVDIYYNENSQSFCCTIDNSELSFGSFNVDYEKDLKYLLDVKLDTIKIFENNLKLEWFKNGTANDVRLMSNQRVLKIWLVKNRTTLTKTALNKIILEAEDISKKIVDKLN